jgi:omega-6 fatty acid desaturase (delta-12 desaturase)
MKLLSKAGSAGSQQIKLDWYKATARYEKPNLQKAIWQLVNTFIPYITLWGLMIFTIQHAYPYWITMGTHFHLFP